MKDDKDKTLPPGARRLGDQLVEYISEQLGIETEQSRCRAENEDITKQGKRLPGSGFSRS